MSAGITRLSPGRQRALAVLLLLALAGAAIAAVIVPVVVLHRHYDEAITSFQDRLARYQRVASRAPGYRKALEAMRERDARRFLLKNTAANLAGAELQEIVRAAIEGNGGRITTSQNQPPKDEGHFRQIGVNVQFFATTANLQKVLFALEAQQPYLLVENLTLRPVNAFRGYRPSPGQEPEVNVHLDVAAYSLSDKPEAPRAPGAPAAATLPPASSPRG
ncbi:MAG: type II secretion system protein GspM [Casimicrobiaceae bacterium]